MARRRKSIVQPLSKRSSVRVLRQFSRSSYISAQLGPATREGGAIEKSKNELALNPTVVRSKRKVRILHRNDPYNVNSTTGIASTGATQATFSKEFDQFTNNTNVKYDPSRGPSGTVPELTVYDAAMEKPGKASRGHQKVIARTLFNQNAGSTLRRR